ncbi:DNA polymerase [Parelusimicrobium proximum]|uniref:uracil-DNA glycosylase n=1 Tax=Parelusimicrobium proximum TaxID=3228953 RepID=UPI003D16E8E2
MTKQNIAKELKKFILAANEDDMIITGAPKKAPVTNNTAPVQTVKKAAQSVPSDIAAAPAPQNIESVEPMPKKSAAPQAPKAEKTQKTESKILSTEEKVKAVNDIAEEIKNCKKCPLGSTRLNAVPGEGDVNARIMFVGEGPGFDEDHKGRPFIGRAGTLLTKMIEAMGLKREDVFIANIAKCHPMIDPSNPEKHGNDRAPDANEIAFCRKYIEKQISVILPEYIVALGAVAGKALIRDAKSLAALRGKFFDLDLDSVTLARPVKIIATFHPAALLRNPNWKKDAWADLQMLMKHAGLKAPDKSI